MRTDEFETLKKQGPKVLAFLVFKLATDVEQNSYGVFLCKSPTLILGATTSLTQLSQRSGERPQILRYPR